MRLRGFYEEAAPKAVDALLSAFHPQGQSFFDWLEAQGIDRGILWKNLQNMVNMRNEIAHGNLSQKPTLVDARRFAGTARTLVQGADSYVRSCYPALA